jgi:hypothetical protein
LAAVIIGHGTKGTADGQGIPGDSYGVLLQTQTTVSSLGGLTTTLGTAANSFGIGKTTATILAGTLGTSSTLTETWRSRSSGELPANAKANNNLPLYSDVVNLNGAGNGTPYAFQMTYDPNELGGTAAAAAAATNGFLYLGYRDPNSGKWANAVLANSATGANATANVQSSFAAFTAANPSFTLASMLGSWGVDTANDTVWGVVNHDAEFAAVPEPGTMALLAGGVAALGYTYRRRRKAARV